MTRSYEDAEESVNDYDAEIRKCTNSLDELGDAIKKLEKSLNRTKKPENRVKKQKEIDEKEAEREKVEKRKDNLESGKFREEQKKRKGSSKGRGLTPTKQRVHWERWMTTAPRDMCHTDGNSAARMSISLPKGD